MPESSAQASSPEPITPTDLSLQLYTPDQTTMSTSANPGFSSHQIEQLQQAVDNGVRAGLQPLKDDIQHLRQLIRMADLRTDIPHRL